MGEENILKLKRQMQKPQKTEKNSAKFNTANLNP